MKREALVVIALGLTPLLAGGHSGGLDEYGCHTNHSTGDYHCHNSKPPPLPPPSPCAGKSVTWSVGADVCSASILTISSGTITTAFDDVLPVTGSATFSCTNGVWSEATGASCKVQPPPPPPETAIKPTPPTSACEPVDLAFVVDGDTLHVRSSKGLEKIRISQVDAPERSQPFGIEATSCLENAVSSGSLVVCRDGTDRYGRTVANVQSGGFDVARVLVSQGCAWAYQKYLEANSPLPALEAAARQARMGLWAGEALAPWLYRSGVSPVTISAATGQPSVMVHASNQASVHDRVFDWAEHVYPDLFTKGSTNQMLHDGTIYRCYSTGYCVGYRQGRFLVYDGVEIREVGTEADFLPQADAHGF